MSSELEIEIEKWKKRFERERASRKESENLLEAKSLELYESNQSLEKEVQKRTQSLEDALKKLQEADEAKTNFLANMSHEIKTPLNSINILSSVMAGNKNGHLTEQDVKNLNIINKSGKYLLEIINDILDISKIEIGELDIYNEKLNLKMIMIDIYEMIFPQTVDRDINLIFSCDDSIGYVFQDEKRIRQIVKNILSNSLKFTEKGMISFVVTDEEEYFRIVIEDQGIGIPENKLEHIFERFKQVDGSTTRKYGGTGLGLAICKELVHLLKGSIEVFSELGVGTRFEVVLPKNKQLLTGFDMINKRFENFQHKNVEDSFEMDWEESNYEAKPTLYLINSNPITFIKVVLQLKKKFDLVQVSSFEDINGEESQYLFVDSNILDDNFINHVKNLDLKLILLGENDKIINQIGENIHLIIKDSIDNFDFESINL